MDSSAARRRALPGWYCFNVNAAFDFAACPTSGTRIVGIQWKRSTWLAAYGGIAAFIERQQRNRKFLAGIPDIARGPRSEGSKFQHLLAAGESEHRGLFESGAALCLLAPQARNPNTISGDFLEERLNLAQLAALVGSGLIKKAVLRLLFGHGLFGEKVDKVQLPPADHTIPIGVGFLEVVARIEKQNGNPRIELDGQLRQQNVFGLKAACEAYILLACDLGRQSRADFVEFGFHLRLDLDCAHHKPTFSDGMKMAVSCNSRWTAETTCSGLLASRVCS